MKQNIFTILSNDSLTPNVFSMWLSGDTTGICAGQFVNIEVPNWYLRRPISVCEIAPNRLRIVYKVVGTGTKDLSLLQAGEELSVLTELGNGYDLNKAGVHPLLVGGGIGVPPLLQLAKQLRAAGKAVAVVLGFNTASEVILEEEFIALGCDVHVCTMDGTYGTKGLVTDVISILNTEHRAQNSYFYTCGPILMLKALHQTLSIDGEFSLEERMGCGFGACMGCTLETRSGHKRVCKEGPVFAKSDLLW